MKLKIENGRVPFSMRTGNDFVRSTMDVNVANEMIEASKDVEETTERGRKELKVDGNYFFTLEDEKKPTKKGGKKNE